MHERSGTFGGSPRRRRFALTAAAAAMVMSRAPVSADVQYAVKDLGVLHPGWGTLAEGVNNSGVTAGTAEAPGFSPYRALRLDHGNVLDIGTLGGGLAEAFAINDAGQIVGDATLGSDPLTYHAFRWTSGVMLDLGVFPPQNVSQARGINSQGDVVGIALKSSGAAVSFHPFLWHNGVLSDLAPASGFTDTYAEGINDGGLVVGTQNPGGSTAKAVKWSGGVMTMLNSLLPGGSGISLREAHGVNNAGQIVGEAVFGGGPSQHGFVLTNGVVDDFGIPAGADFSRAWAINESGHAVGDVFYTSEAPHAVLRRDGATIDLNAVIDPALGVHLSNAFGINDCGQIAVTGHYNSTPLVFRAFLLTPINPKDLTGDGKVDVDDLFVVINSWGSCRGCPADVAPSPDGDGEVDVDDLFAVINAWTACP